MVLYLKSNNYNCLKKKLIESKRRTDRRRGRRKKREGEGEGDSGAERRGDSGWSDQAKHDTIWMSNHPLLLILLIFLLIVPSIFFVSQEEVTAAAVNLQSRRLAVKRIKISSRQYLVKSNQVKSLMGFPRKLLVPKLMSFGLRRQLGNQLECWERRL